MKPFTAQPIAVFSLLCGIQTTAYAHTRLTTPASRTSSADLTTGPCGGIAGSTGSVATFSAGSLAAVTFDTNTAHNGPGGNPSTTYTIAFSAAGDANFKTLKTETFSGTGSRTVNNVPLPNTPCDACTLQLVQNRGDGGGSYYSCANIKLTAMAGTDSGVPVFDGSTSGSTDASTTGSTTGSSGSGGGSSGGCSIVPDGTTHSSRKAIIFLVLAAGWFVYRRRSRRGSAV